MDRLKNPYTPGAGTPPPALVGRARPLGAADVALRRALVGRPFRPPMLVGLRGVGKTVLLREVVRQAQAVQCLTAELEIEEAGSLPGLLVGELRKVLMEIRVTTRVADLARRALGILKAFSLAWPGGPEIRFDVEAVPGPADSGNLGADLAELLATVGETVRAVHRGFCLTVDEVQYLPDEEFGALIMGLHRMAQRSLPVVACLAGLPTIYAKAGRAKSYAERLFDLQEIGPLTLEDTVSAIEGPAAEEGVNWTGASSRHIFKLSGGFPFFVQEFASQAWNVAEGPSDITPRDVDRAGDLATHELDRGFFRVRFDRTTDAERRYLVAMAELGPGPHAPAAIADRMGKRPNQLAPTRQRLIESGLCYMPRRGEIAFTVPMFDRFLARTPL